MTAPLKRDRQIELMSGAKERMEKRVRGWLSHPQIREAATHVPEGHRYVRSVSKKSIKAIRGG